MLPRRCSSCYFRGFCNVAQCCFCCCTSRRKLLQRCSSNASRRCFRCCMKVPLPEPQCALATLLDAVSAAAGATKRCCNAPLCCFCCCRTLLQRSWTLLLLLEEAHCALPPEGACTALNGLWKLISRYDSFSPMSICVYI